MRLMLTGPRAGKTEKIAGVQFINGYAEWPSLPRVLERYYGVVEAPVEVVQESDVSTKDVQQESMDEDILRQVIEAKKKEIEEKAEQVENLSLDGVDWKSMPFLTQKAFIKKISGKAPKNKEEAYKIMAECGYV